MKKPYIGYKTDTKKIYIYTLGIPIANEKMWLLEYILNTCNMI